MTPSLLRPTRRQVVGGALVASLAAPAIGSRLPARARQEPGPHVQAVVTTHQASTDAGLAMLAQGGTAADAAIAIASVLSVVEGWFSSVLGGGTWALYYDAAKGAVTSLDGVGPTGSNATREDYAARAGQSGIHQSNVPGAWDGWMIWLQEYGRLDLGPLLQPAIDLARDGHPASADLAEWASTLEREVLANPGAAAIYAPGGELVGAGDTVVMPDLAATFEALVEAYDAGLPESREVAIQAARDYYYRGPLAEAIVAFSDANDGYLTRDDFAGFAAEIVSPLSIQYGDFTVYENPPNSQGITMLLALNMLKGMGLTGRNVDNPDVVHTQIEAMKLAFADRYRYIGDPDRVEMPIEDLLSEEYAAAQRQRIDVETVQSWPISSGLDWSRAPAHTTTFQVVDREGNGASVTTSLGAQFLVVEGTGIHMNNRMRMLSVEPGNANELTPGYKVRHTSCPYMALRNGRPVILGGNTGADTQPQGQLQQFLSVVEFGLSAQEAVSRPRWITTAFPAGTHDWGVGNQLRMQEGFIGPLVSALTDRGHDVVIGEGTFGSASMIIVSDDGTDAEFGAEPSLPDAAGAIIPAG
jgi:gamma-glutamyltranspeptidase/glutathione hydrolase